MVETRISDLDVRSPTKRGLQPGQDRRGLRTSSFGLARRTALLLWLIVADGASLIAAWLFAAGLMLIVNLGTPDWQQLLWLLPTFIASCAIVGLYHGLGSAPVARLRKRLNAVALLAGLAIASSVSELTILSVPFLAAFLIASFVTSYYGETLVRTFMPARQWSAPALVVGNDQLVSALVETLREHESLGLLPVAKLDVQSDQRARGDRDRDWPILSERLINLQSSHTPIESIEVILLSSPEDGRAVAQAWPQHLELPKLLYVHDQNVRRSEPSDVRSLGRYVAYEYRVDDPNKGMSRLLKRAMDLLITIPAVILIAPVVAGAAVMIKIIDPGPAFFVQKRVGRGGGLFGVIKLRSMYIDADKRLEKHLTDDAETRKEWDRYFKLRNDPRILGRIGNFIRRSSIDELPQLWNVIRGDMSLIGPRPFPEYHLAGFDEEFRRLRASVQPGLTGYWQVHHRSDGDLSIQKKCDTYYIENWSIWLDVEILLKTVPAVLLGKGAV